MINNSEERIQKLIANYGSYSRRQIEKLIIEKRVKVNGQIAILGTKATVNDSIKIDDKIIKLNLKHEYYLVNKPKGYICAREDKFGKETISLINNYKNRNLFTVGRLDVETTGLIIVTSDGDLLNNILLPSRKVKKTYLVWLERKLSRDDINKVLKGVELDDGYVTKPPTKFKIISNTEKSILVKLIITEGKKNQIRRTFGALNNKVINLKRIQIGQHKLEKITFGNYRKISREEMYNGLGIYK